MQCRGTLVHGDKWLSIQKKRIAQGENILAAMYDFPPWRVHILCLAVSGVNFENDRHQRQAGQDLDI
ncbi:hypothetical protein Trco_005880 [Trichoderma cornu-damae]|uniref:Uncharacterized protein n=1 Tax=Trichoderma cornu-damae TaxID=654480 RepID=A0A9P8TW69_9HYPO|nr:hypothetical protein Trco_005880 [Trichoderma cornu-damae]